MSESTIVTDAALEEMPHNAPLTANEEDGVDNPEEESNNQPVDPRAELIERIAAQNNEDRAIEPGTRQEDMPAGEPVPDDVIETGLSEQQSFGDTDQESEGLPDEYANDPLAEFIEMDNDEPMFRTVVNGQQELIPLDKARAALQKNLAADQRLREAAEVQQHLAQREAAIMAREQELTQRLSDMHTVTTPPQGEPSMTEEQLTEEARTVVRELFVGTQDDAAAKLADLLLKNRGAAQATTSMNPEEIAQAAVAAARQEISAEQQEADVRKGYKKFCKDYPEIAADDNLFAIADSIVTKIEKENPHWMPSEMMLEAGKRTREWINSQTGSEDNPEATQAQDNRSERKRKLRRVPRARQGAEQTGQAPEPTPADYLSELRQARGLPE